MNLIGIRDAICKLFVYKNTSWSYNCLLSIIIIIIIIIKSETI